MAARQSSSKLASAAPGRLSNVPQLREGMVTSSTGRFVLVVVVGGEHLDAGLVHQQRLEERRHVALVRGNLDGIPAVFDLNVVGELLQLGGGDAREVVRQEELKHVVWEPILRLPNLDLAGLLLRQDEGSKLVDQPL